MGGAGEAARRATHAPDVEEVGDAVGAEVRLDGAEEGLVRLEVEAVDARVREARARAQPPPRGRRRRARIAAAQERVLAPRHPGPLALALAVVLLLLGRRGRRGRRQRHEAGRAQDGLQLGVGQDGPERGRVPQRQLLRHLLDGHPPLPALAGRLRLRLRHGRRAPRVRGGFLGVYGGLVGGWVDEGDGNRATTPLALFMRGAEIVFSTNQIKGEREWQGLKGEEAGGGHRTAQGGR